MSRRRMMFVLAAIFVVANPFGPPGAAAGDAGQSAAPAIDDSGWPREIVTPAGYTITIYQGQPETLNGDVLTGRSAFSIVKGPGEPVFGVMWISAAIDTDRDERICTVRDMKITKVRIPDATPEEEKQFTGVVQTEISKWDFTISLDRLTASLAAVEEEKKSAAGLKSDPPEIRFSEEPAVLLLYDGEPKFSTIESSNLERIINTPFLVVRKEGDRTAYLSGAGYWYWASDPKGPWRPEANPPPEIAGLVEPDSTSLAAKGIAPPKIVVATEPTELIVFNGKADYAPLTGTDLIYATNTESDVVKDLQTRDTYVLLSGRWFKSRSLDGPWTFVNPKDLPADFAQVPPGSPMGEMRASVPGTEEAEDAVADAQIPQTQAIKRDATITIQYDGEPKFEKIEGTDVEYAVNTAESVLKIKGRYYCCHEAVWYASISPKGPWQVSEERPSEVDQIPASNPTYSTKYVYVYDSTPSVIYMGYTPGYCGWYPYYGTVWYGTGWIYRPWYGPYYYPRPCTWGFGVHYNPYMGWTCGVSWSVGFMSAGVGWGGGYYRPPYHGGGWYGPRGYHPRPVHYGSTNMNINTGVNIGNKVNIGDRPGGARPSTRPGTTRPATMDRPNNLYNKRDNLDRNAPSTRDVSARKPQVAKNRPNNVLADRDGNVYRRNPDGSMDMRDKTGWKPTTRPGAETKPATPGTGAQNRPAMPSTGSKDLSPRPTTRDRQQIERDYRARDRGTQRTRQAQPYRQSRPAQPSTRPSTRPSGGGGRRR